MAGLDNLKKFEQRMRGDAGVQRALKAQGLDQAKAAWPAVRRRRD